MNLKTLNCCHFYLALCVAVPDFCKLMAGRTRCFQTLTCHCTSLHSTPLFTPLHNALHSTLHSSGNYTRHDERLSHQYSFNIIASCLGPPGVAAKFLSLILRFPSQHNAEVHIYSSMALHSCFPSPHTLHLHLNVRCQDVMSLGPARRPSPPLGGRSLGFLAPVLGFFEMFTPVGPVRSALSG